MNESTASIPAQNPATRRVRGVVLAALYLLASTVGPLTHLIDHAPDHTHGPAGTAYRHGSVRHAHPSPANVDLDAFRDPESGRVDLAALSHALGIGDHSHSHDGDHHSEGHDHGPAHHGNGALEHFALALLTPEPPVRIVERPALELPPPLPLTSLSVPPRPELLEVQYAQGPPAFFRS